MVFGLFFPKHKEHAMNASGEPTRDVAVCGLVGGRVRFDELVLRLYWKNDEEIVGLERKLASLRNQQACWRST